MSERAHAAAPDVDAERERREDEEDDDLMERLERRRGADSTRMRRARAPRVCDRVQGSAPTARSPAAQRGLL